MVKKIWWFIFFSLILLSLSVSFFAGDTTWLVFAVYGLNFGTAVLLLFLEKDRIKKKLSSPYTKNLVTNSLQVLLIFLIICMVNIISIRLDRSFDMTESKLHTLSKQSLKVLSKIESEFKITLFAKRSNWEKYLGLLRQYQYGNVLVTIDAKDIEAHPDLVKSRGIQSEGTVIVEYSGKTAQAKIDNELNMTNLILKVLEQRSLRVYYTVGHKELSQGNSKPDGASYLFSTLSNTNVDLRPLDTLKERQIPDDADIVLVLGPKAGFLKLEVKLLQNYLKRGGNIFFLLGPQFFGVDLKNLYGLLTPYGLEFKNYLTLDRLSTVQGMQATVPIISKYSPTHSITKNFTERTIYPIAAALKEIPKSEYVDLDILAKTSPFPGSWAESELDTINSGKVFYNKKRDLKGPIGLFAVAQRKDDLSKIAVITSPSFVTNSYKNQSSNFNLFINTLYWLADQEGIISLNRPMLRSNLIILTQTQLSFIFFGGVLILPLLLGFAAFTLYKRRREQ